MNNDLISRSALKEDIVKLCRQINASNGITVPTLAFTRVIDNAPTVEIATNLQPTCNNLQQRPQGEWQYTTHHARRYRICPFCKCEKEDDRSAGWFYCWHCGADMQKGGAEND